MLCNISITLVDMLGLFTGQDNIHGFKSFSHFPNEKIKNFSPIKSIDQMLPYRLYVFRTNQNITSPTMIFSHARKSTVRIGYNFSLIWWLLKVPLKNLRKEPIVIIVSGSEDATSHEYNNRVVKGSSAKFRSKSCC